jgi:TRAP-type uncharacterized transport system substrate-binding protein
MIIRRAALALVVIAAVGAASGKAQIIESSHQRPGNTGTLRIVPLSGLGPVQSVVDLLNSRRADVATVPSDVLPYLRNGPLPDIGSSIAYIRKLDQEEVHILARQDIINIADLAGKRVNFDARDSHSFITASVLFRALKIDVQPVSLDQPRALQLLRQGDIAATVYVAKSPARLFFDLNREDGVHFVPVPFTAEVARTYLPGRLNPADYPLLIGGGEVGRGVAVATVAVPNVLAINNRALVTGSEGISPLVDALSTRPVTPQASPSTSAQTAYQIAEVPGWRRVTPAENRQPNIAGAANAAVKPAPAPRHAAPGSPRKEAPRLEAGALPPLLAPSSQPASRQNAEISANKEDIAEEFIRYWQHAFAEGHQSEATQGQSGTSTEHRSGTSSVTAMLQEREALMREFLRWEKYHPEQSPQALGEVFAKVLETVFKP